ncbi:MAG: mechanosensitive ion channel family protein [Microgenomates group bacterium]
MIDVVNMILVNFFRSVGSFLPNLFAGILILIIGVLIASILKHLIVTLFHFLKVDDLIHKTKIFPKGQMKIWVEVLTEIFKWMLIIVFLIPTLEIWGLSKATNVLNDFLYYLPNVVVAVVIAFVGLLAANLTSDLVRHSVKTLGSQSANTLAVFSKWTINFFTALVVLNQLGVAQDLVRILFTGIVAMLALAGGLAFGLGGKDVAKELLEDLKRKLQS